MRETDVTSNWFLTKGALPWYGQHVDGTCGRDAAYRQNMIEQLMGEIMNYDAEFRKQEVMGTSNSTARH